MTTASEVLQGEYQLQLEAMLAFHAALGAVEDIAKTETADTGKYTYRYASLPAVLDEVKRACELHGLAMFQVPTATDGMLQLYTRLIHKNGGVVEFDPIVLRLPNEAQPFGSALTYLRRYSLLTIFGIATEDDDGKAATIAAQTQPGRRTEAERMIRESMATMDQGMRDAFVADFKADFGSNLTDLAAARHGDALTWSRSWIDAYEPSALPSEQAMAALEQDEAEGAGVAHGAQPEGA